jgi:tetratricopeptide (TPR) repeat protein
MQPIKALLLGSALLMVVGGCADNITFSKDSDREGIKLYNQQKYAEAAGAFRNAIRQNPRDYRAQYYMGASLDALGQYQEAILAYKAGLDVMHTSLEGKVDAPFREKMLDALATDIARSADRDTEIQSLTKRAAADRNAENYLLLARINRNVGDPDSAIEAYKQGAAVDPNNFYLLKEYGLYLQQLGLNQKAEPVLRQAYAINNQDDQVAAALRQAGGK